MKRIVSIILGLTLILSMGACAVGESDADNNAPRAGTADKTNTKILVAYFSNTGNTAALAEYAADILNADLHEIQAEIPYTSGDLNHGDSSSRSTKEQNDASARPTIAGQVENMAQYDAVVLGYPIWWGQAPKIISTFLERYDFSGKTIVPFCTSGSSGIGSSAGNLHGLTPESTIWMEGKRFAAGTSGEELAGWLDSLSLTASALSNASVSSFDLERGENGKAPTVLLNSGYEIPIAGIGTYSLEGDECVNAISAALKSGVRLIDTAFMPWYLAR